MYKRYYELDSLRGLAAFSVLLLHLVSIFPAFNEPISQDRSFGWFLIKNSPINILFSGHSAVILFFALSGFVLAFPFFKGHVNPGEFLIKRICRIYIPYWVVVGIAILLRGIFAKVDGISDLSAWFNAFWHTNITWKLLMQHLLLIGQYDTNALDYITWSLVHEMRISLIFPFIMFFITRFGWKFNLMMGLSLSVISWVIQLYLDKMQLEFNPFYLTVHYILMFIVGALLAQHSELLINRYKKVRKGNKILALILGASLYTYSPMVFLKLNLWAVADWGICAGASIFILVALSSKVVTEILLKRPILFLGKISYSLYLLHAVVLLALLHAFHGKIALWVILLLVTAVSFVISTTLYYFVELPSIRLGKYLTGRTKKPKQSVTESI